MGDERKCYAGDLGTDHLGKTVRVETVSGAEVADGLCEIRHWLPTGAAPRTWLQFKNVRPAVGSSPQLSLQSVGFEVDPTTVVTVL